MTMYDLAGFQGYLIRSGLRHASIKQVMYRVESALAVIRDMANEQEVNEYHLSLPAASRGNFRSSWRKWATFVSTELGADVATLPEMPRGRIPKHIRMPLPEEAQAAVTVLIREVPALALASMRWRDVIVRSEKTYLRSVLDARSRNSDADTHRTYPELSTAGVAALASLRAWAVPEGLPAVVAGELPIVPMSPGSHIPASGGLLRALGV